MGVPDIPSVSSCLLLAARQSLHTRSLLGNSGCSKSGDGTEEGCPWDTHTHPEGRASSCHSPAHGWLHLCDSPCPGAHGGWEVQEGSPGSRYQSHAQCPQFRPGASTGLEALESLVATPDERHWLCPCLSHPLVPSHRRAREISGRSCFQTGPPQPPRRPRRVFPARPGPSGGCQEAGWVRGVRSQNTLMQVLQSSGWRGWCN